MNPSGKGTSHGLKPRHVTMVSIAGVIGAGLFVGSGRAFAEAGPAALLTYAIAGLLMVLVMRMLGEMAVEQPDTGSFSTYADDAIGHWAGFTIGWLYWWFWVLVIPIEATAAAAMLNAWWPAVPQWAIALAITLVLTGTHLFSVRNNGEFEFWFALIKVVAIVAFIAVGGLALLGQLPWTRVSGMPRLVDYGGLMPNGANLVVGASLTTMFAFMGAEIVTTAAAKAEHPARQFVRATRSVVWRISLFYLGSVFIVAALVPWNDPLLITHRAYQRALEILGVPHAKAMVDVIVLTAVMSCLNSALYTASRMLFLLSTRGDAPSGLSRTAACGTPRAAVLVSTAFGFVCVLANYLMPERLFAFLLATSGAVALLVCLVIAISQLRMRAVLERRAAALPLRTWCYPWLMWSVIVVILGVLAVMVWHPAHRMEILATATLLAGVLAGAWQITRNRRADGRALAMDDSP